MHVETSPRAARCVRLTEENSLPSASLRGTVLNDSGEGLRRIRESTDVTGVSGSTHPIPGPLAAPKPAPRKKAPKPKTQPRKESLQPSMFAAAQGRNNSSQR